MLSNCGLTDVGLNRLARLHDSVLHNTVSKKLSNLANRYDELLKQWDSELKEYSVVLDNVDMLTKPRREMAEKGNRMNHMVQAIAVEERVQPSADNSSQEVNVEEIRPTDVYPTSSDKLQLKEMMVKRLVAIWSELPAMKNVPLDRSVVTHKYTPQMSQKTDYVSGMF